MICRWSVDDLGYDSLIYPTCVTYFSPIAIEHPPIRISSRIAFMPTFSHVFPFFAFFRLSSRACSVVPSWHVWYELLCIHRGHPRPVPRPSPTVRLRRASSVLQLPIPWVRVCFRFFLVFFHLVYFLEWDVSTYSPISSQFFFWGVPTHQQIKHTAVKPGEKQYLFFAFGVLASFFFFFSWVGRSTNSPRSPIFLSGFSNQSTIKSTQQSNNNQRSQKIKRHMILHDLLFPWERDFVFFRVV